jgi:hypothetical protein
MARLAAVCIFVLGAALTVALPMSGSAKNPDHFVLRVQDLPAGFQPAGAGYVSLTVDARDLGVTVPELASWGYVTGYRSRFTPTGGVMNTSSRSYSVHSSAWLWRTIADAHQALLRDASTCTKLSGKRLGLNTTIGDEAVLCSITKKEFGLLAHMYVLSWRNANDTGDVETLGFIPGLLLSQTERLARLQDHRME